MKSAVSVFVALMMYAAGQQPTANQATVAVTKETQTPAANPLPNPSFEEKPADAASSRGAVDTSRSPHAKLKTLPMTDVNAKISRAWKAGDVIELNLPMPVRLMEANPKVKNLRNKVAAMRGPLVYCLELPKREGGEKTWHDGVFLPENIALKPEHRSDFLGGVTVLKGNALTFKGRDRFIKDIAGAAAPKPAADTDDWLYRPFTPRALREADEGIVEISLIPYYAWANRGLSMMEVWIPLAR